MPKRTTRHIPKPQHPLGWVKEGKIKVQDGETGKVSWRGVRRGLLADFDGDPTSTRHNYKDAVDVNHHSVHMGKRKAKTTITSEE